MIGKFDVFFNSVETKKSGDKEYRYVNLLQGDAMTRVRIEDINVYAEMSRLARFVELVVELEIKEGSYNGAKYINYNLVSYRAKDKK